MWQEVSQEPKNYQADDLIERVTIIIVKYETSLINYCGFN